MHRCGQDEGGILDELELPTAQQSEGPTVQEGETGERIILLVQNREEDDAIATCI